MNRVFHSHLRKAGGVLHFSKAERRVLAAVAVIAFLVASVAHLFVGVGAFAAIFSAVVIHRRADNNRLDHLEILLRGLTGPPVWSLCERDCSYKRFEHEIQN
jgi:hypothetical protein